MLATKTLAIVHRNMIVIPVGGAPTASRNALISTVTIRMHATVTLATAPTSIVVIQVIGAKIAS